MYQLPLKRIVSAPEPGRRPLAALAPERELARQETALGPRRHLSVAPRREREPSAPAPPSATSTRITCCLVRVAARLWCKAQGISARPPPTRHAPAQARQKRVALALEPEPAPATTPALVLERLVRVVLAMELEPA